MLTNTLTQLMAETAPQVQGYQNLYTSCYDRLKETFLFAATPPKEVKATLFNSLYRIDRMANDDNEYAVLSFDFAPHSFTFIVINHLTKKWLINGGLIYHGDSNGWQIHT